jgi:hypothetical protein
LDPTHWPPGTGTLLFVAWLAYAAASTLWVNLLIWTVLPAGLALYLIAAWYPWRVVLFLILPLTLLTVLSQLVALSPEAPIWIAVAIYLVACGYFSFLVSSDDRDRWIARLPSWLLGERFAGRLAWARFEAATLAANAVVRQIDANVGKEGRQAAIQRLATEARRESRRGGIWQEAWSAQAGWLDGLGELGATKPSADTIRRVNDALSAMNGAHLVAIERTTGADPAPPDPEPR